MSIKTTSGYDPRNSEWEGILIDKCKPSKWKQWKGELKNDEAKV
ncbi:hypothetical protein RINTHM_4800 [Richelia intracellularis HM01]|nr:hypothetical protein RINTHM_4800 [Richelia intracellularis HM01]